jgi:hypothetical protein
MSCATQDGTDGIAKRAFEPISVQLAIALHMPDGRFDDATATNHGFDPARHATFFPWALDVHLLDLYTLVVVIDEHHFRLHARDDICRKDQRQDEPLSTRIKRIYSLV